MAKTIPKESTGAQAVVIEHRLDALLPLAALIDQRVAQPHPRAQIEQMVRAGSTTPAAWRSSTARDLPSVCAV
jgi:hypothetical protein